ncbi:hypothetical protein DAMNIGENAA_19910 [Desulforhabdus amnigena]|uniref:Uncharacterized protein n=1 Tax=Desulforhabdus amnigena TaxID=40218 RepID=A0A9W6D3F1_9BACT|nr:hypothetical protein DAMNIGENAA_19910 [Desulforhabdus amnigena]
MFTVVAMLGLTLTWLGSMEALSVLNSFGPLEERKSQEALAHIAGIGFGFIGNYIGHKYITFRR